MSAAEGSASVWRGSEEGWPGGLNGIALNDGESGNAAFDAASPVVPPVAFGVEGSGAVVRGCGPSVLKVLENFCGGGNDSSLCPVTAVNSTEGKFESKIGACMFSGAGALPVGVFITRGSTTKEPVVETLVAEILAAKVPSAKVLTVEALSRVFLPGLPPEKFAASLLSGLSVVCPSGRWTSGGLLPALAVCKIPANVAPADTDEGITFAICPLEVGIAGGPLSGWIAFATTSLISQRPLEVVAKRLPLRFRDITGTSKPNPSG